jgi:hypothetical protein
MKTIFYFIVTCFVSTFSFWGAIGSKNPFPLYAVAFGIWALFLWGYNRRLKKEAYKRAGERMFMDVMRSRGRHR